MILRTILYHNANSLILLGLLKIRVKKPNSCHDEFLFEFVCVEYWEAEFISKSTRPLKPINPHLNQNYFKIPKINVTPHILNFLKWF